MTHRDRLNLFPLAIGIRLYNNYYRNGTNVSVLDETSDGLKHTIRRLTNSNGFDNFDNTMEGSKYWNKVHNDISDLGLYIPSRFASYQDPVHLIKSNIKLIIEDGNYED